MFYYQTRHPRLGAVLIEVAFAILIVMLLINYVHGLPKLKLTPRKAQFVS